MGVILAYKNIPLPSDVLSVSQQDIRANFSQANTSFGTDHFAFSDQTAQNGIHKQVRLQNQVPAGFAPGDGALYAQLIAGNSWPVWQNATGATIMMSSPTQALTNGYCSLPGGLLLRGLLLQWGVIATTGAVTPVLFVTSNKNFPTACFNVLITPSVASVNNNQQFSVGNVSSTGFSIGVNSGYPVGSNFFWVAIGN